MQAQDKDLVLGFVEPHQGTVGPSLFFFPLFWLWVSGLCLPLGLPASGSSEVAPAAEGSVPEVSTAMICIEKGRERETTQDTSGQVGGP